MGYKDLLSRVRKWNLNFIDKDSNLFRAWEVLEDISVLPVLNPNLQLIHVIQDVELSEGDGGVPVDHGGVAEEGDVQPAATAGPPRRHAELVTSLLEVGAGVLQKREPNQFIESGNN